MAIGFDVDLNEIQQWVGRWNDQLPEAKQLLNLLGAVEVDLNTISSSPGFAIEAFLGPDAGVLLMLRAAVSDLSSKLNASVTQWEQDAATLARCQEEYELAEAAALDGVNSVTQFAEFQAPGTKADPNKIYKILSQYSTTDPNSQKAKDRQQLIDGAQDIVSASPDSVAKTITDTGPDWASWAQGIYTDPPKPQPPAAVNPPGAEFGEGGGSGSTTTDS